METIVSAPIDGKVKRVAVVQNDAVAQGDLLCEVRATPAEADTDAPDCINTTVRARKTEN